MKVICIGDSVTYGQNVRADEAWPAVLADRTGWDVRNEGVCGDTTRLGLERFPKAAQLHRPEVVVVQFGHNDANCWETDNGLPRVSADAYVSNIMEMIGRSKAFGAEAIIILQPHAAPELDRDYNLRLMNYRGRIRGWSLEPPEPSLLDDGYGLHPDPEMHEAYARLVSKSLVFVEKQVA